MKTKLTANFKTKQLKAKEESEIIQLCSLRAIANQRLNKKGLVQWITKALLNQAVKRRVLIKRLDSPQRVHNQLESKYSRKEN